jgi:hypothetical protein
MVPVVPVAAVEPALRSIEVVELESDSPPKVTVPDADASIVVVVPEPDTADDVVVVLVVVVVVVVELPWWWWCRRHTAM